MSGGGASPSRAQKVARRIGAGILDFETALVAARAPLLAAAAYVLILVVPDQSVEAVRATDQGGSWTRNLVGHLSLFLALYLSLCFAYYAIFILGDHQS